MATAASAEATAWLWYTQKTSNCAPLDPAAYSSEALDGRLMRWPSWVCRGPNGGGHVNSGVGQIDAHVSALPRGRIEVSWTCEFGLFLVATSWLALINDLVDGKRVHVGALYANGVKSETWATIHGQSNPPLSSRAGTARVCPNCGNIAPTVRGRAFFSDPAAIGLPLIVNWNGIFVREDVATNRNLRMPAGAFKPTPVRFEGATH